MAELRMSQIPINLIGFKQAEKLHPNADRMGRRPKHALKNLTHASSLAEDQGR
jgi:hypothetical protein